VQFDAIFPPVGCQHRIPGRGNSFRSISAISRSSSTIKIACVWLVQGGSLLKRCFINVEIAGALQSKQRLFAPPEFIPTREPFQTFLQQAGGDKTGRFIGMTTPAHRAAMNGIDEMIIPINWRWNAGRWSG
jgi:hypothetical protein